MDNIQLIIIAVLALLILHTFCKKENLEGDSPSIQETVMMKANQAKKAAESWLKNNIK